jgi:formamidopyrimidine-DNA glycosylase
MPELPEVETIVRELRESVCGKEISKIEAPWRKAVKPALNVAARILKGSKVEDVMRRGKFIIFILNKNVRLVVHLRMTGRLLWRVEQGRAKFIRVILRFADGSSLYFSDVRRFGRVWVYPVEVYKKATGISKLGVEPLDLDWESFKGIFKGRRGILKHSLLRQDLLAGVGNIYADEICFRIGLHPLTRLEKLGNDQLRSLFKAIGECLRDGIEHCGASISDFVGTKGTIGQHQHYLRVYGRKGKPCYSCSNLIKKTVVAGRGTFFCPSCQPILKK